jgi:hypothetical protein
LLSGYLLGGYSLGDDHLCNWLLNWSRLSYYLLRLHWRLDRCHIDLLLRYLLSLNGLNWLNWLLRQGSLNGLLHGLLHWWHLLHGHLLYWWHGHRLLVYGHWLGVHLGLHKLRNCHRLHRLGIHHLLGIGWLHHLLRILLVDLLLRLQGYTRLLGSSGHSFPIGIRHLLSLVCCLLHILLSFLLLKLLVSHRWDLCHRKNKFIIIC